MNRMVAGRACCGFTNLPHASGKRYLALICRADDSSSDLTAIWRIYLSPDGAKADIKPQDGAGAFYRAARACIGVRQGASGCEGIESALGAWLLIGRAYLVGAALSTAG